MKNNLELERLRNELQEREREKQIMERLILTVDFNPFCSNNHLHYESQQRWQIR